MHIKGRVFVVTGASSGLGHAACQAVIQAGGRIIAIDLNQDVGNRLESELGPDSVIFIEANILNSGSIENALDKGIGKFGCVHGLINCAGIGAPKKVLSSRGVMALEDFQKVINVNLIGSFNVLRLVCARIAKQDPVTKSGERGVIINVASVAAFDGQIGQASYSASKAGIVGMTLPLARELAAHGIRVMTIAPGIFQTPMMSELSESVQKSLAAQVPFPKRLGKPQEFGQFCLTIIENEYLNGETVRLDGSIRMAAL